MDRVLVGCLARLCWLALYGSMGLVQAKHVPKSAICREYLKNLNASGLLEARSNSTGTLVGLEGKDKHALLYIVVVLLFYSTGIIIGIITYLKREKQEIEEDKTYEDYMNFRNDPGKWARYFSVQRMVMHLNNVEADRRRRLQEQQEAEEALRRQESGEEEHHKRSFLSTLRRGSGAGKANKKRFSLIDSSLFSARTRTKDHDEENPEPPRRWSLKPGLGTKLKLHIHDHHKVKQADMGRRMGSMENMELQECSEPGSEEADQDRQEQDKLTVAENKEHYEDATGTDHRCTETGAGHTTELLDEATALSTTPKLCRIQLPAVTDL